MLAALSAYRTAVLRSLSAKRKGNVDGPASSSLPTSNDPGLEVLLSELVRAALTCVEKWRLTASTISRCGTGDAGALGFQNYLESHASYTALVSPPSSAEDVQASPEELRCPVGGVKGGVCSFFTPFSARSRLSSPSLEQCSMQEIIDGLWCGSYHPATQLDLLQRCRISHILVCIGTVPRFPEQLHYFVIDAEDSDSFVIMNKFDETFKFIDKALKSYDEAAVSCALGMPVENAGSEVCTGLLVHCAAGISRAATITAAYLMKRFRLSPSAALWLIRERRSCVRPNNGFMKQLEAYHQQLKVSALSQ